jgi:sRNA-binding carbon storage regulator CsrA
MFYQRKGEASFEIDSVRIRQIIAENIKIHRNELEGEIVFSNGRCAKKAWETIERLNKHHIERYHFSFI